jgi:hypothetical protein
LRVLGRIPTGSAFAALPLAAALTAATQGWCWILWAASALVALTLAWTFAPWIPYVRGFVPAYRRLQRLEAFWVEGQSFSRRAVHSDAELATWQRDCVDWQRRTLTWVEDHISPVEAARINRVSVSSVHWSGAYNDAHSDGMSAMDAKLDELIRLRDAEAEHLR